MAAIWKSTPALDASDAKLAASAAAGSGLPSPEAIVGVEKIRDLLFGINKTGATSSSLDCAINSLLLRLAGDFPPSHAARLVPDIALAK